MSDVFVFCLFVAGLALVAAGTFMVSVPVGLIVSGGELVFVTTAYSRTT